MTFLCKRVKTGVSDHYYFLSPLFPRQWSQDSDPESSIWQSWPSTICGNGGDRKLVFDFGFTSFRWNSPFSLICGYKNRTWMTLCLLPVLVLTLLSPACCCYVGYFSVLLCCLVELFRLISSCLFVWIVWLSMASYMYGWRCRTICWIDLGHMLFGFIM